MATNRLAGNLSSAMLNQSDPEIVRSGAPAYLLLLDSLIADDGDDPGLLFAGARLYSAYEGGLVNDTARRKGLADKALDYASRGLCQSQPDICATMDKPFTEFEPNVLKVASWDIEGLYVFGTSWAGWIQANLDDWNAIAELPKIEAVLQRVIDLDPAYEAGRAQLYLGVIRTQLPPALGGKPEIGRKHFELAIRYSKGKDLMAKVEFARRYARLLFDQELHDHLLHEVIAANPSVPGLTLSNVIAQRQAKEMLNDDYF
ncbi:MAG: TRAP transporter TatT component family protein [Chromatiales bacterium]